MDRPESKTRDVNIKHVFMNVRLSNSYVIHWRTGFRAWFQTSKAKRLGTSLSWVITQRVVVISYRCFGPILVSLNLEDRTEMLCRNVGKKLPQLAV